jgi:7-cyano-7-deazaguanine synthase
VTDGGPGAGHTVAVLASGGVDSAILVADQARQGATVQPLYIRFGLAWEAAEEAHLRRFLDTISGQLPVLPLLALELPIADVYGSHWSVSGDDVPDETTEDAAVYLPGRNLLLLSKASVWCALHGVGSISLGTLRGNPFPDSLPAFFGGFGALVELGLEHPLTVLTPFAGLTKGQVLERGADLALQHTFSCIDPVGERQCGRCNKCAERRKGFAEIGIDDRTDYAG